MGLTLTMVGSSLKIVSDVATEDEFLFPLTETSIKYDEVGGGVELLNGRHFKYFRHSDVSSPSLADFAALKTQMEAYLTSAYNIVTVGKFRGPIADSFNRPNDTNAYAAGDAIQNATSAPAVRKFTNLFPAGGGSGYLSVFLWIGNVAPTARIRVHLFSALPSVRVGDNVAFAVNSADAANYLGYIDLDALNTGVAVGSSRKEVICTGTDVWYDLQTLDAMTPAQSTTYRPTAILDSNI